MKSMKKKEEISHRHAFDTWKGGVCSCGKTIKEQVHDEMNEKVEVKKIKIKEMYLEEKKGIIRPVYITEDGSEYTWEEVATGNCWVTYVVRKTKIASDNE